MSMVWPYILSGVLTAIACVGVQSAVGGQQAVAAVAPQTVPVPTQWQQQNVYVLPPKPERDDSSLVRELSQQILARKGLVDATP